MQPDIKEEIKADIATNKVILYMKGTKSEPSCGFSSQVVTILNTLGIDYVTRNVLEDDALRTAIKEHSNWPTLPQLYIDGEFIGGCDIVTQLYESGDLTAKLEAINAKER
ncbi:MAG: Grx4 family monothiol glutaredoxin [Chlamydiota bacterium]